MESAAAKAARSRRTFYELKELTTGYGRTMGAFLVVVGATMVACSQGVVELSRTPRVLAPGTVIRFSAPMRREGTETGVCLVPAAPFEEYRYGPPGAAEVYDPTHPNRPPVRIRASFISGNRIVPARLGSSASEWDPPHHRTMCLAPVSDSVFSSVTLAVSDTLPVEHIFWESYTPQGLL